jgi:hypothetical protein
MERGPFKENPQTCEPLIYTLQKERSCIPLEPAAELALESALEPE